MRKAEHIKELQKRLHEVNFNNLKMRLEIEQLVDRPCSRASKKIIAKYKRKKAEREEAMLAGQN